MFVFPLYASIKMLQKSLSGVKRSRRCRPLCFEGMLSCIQQKGELDLPLWGKKNKKKKKKRWRGDLWKRLSNSIVPEPPLISWKKESRVTWPIIKVVSISIHKIFLSLFFFSRVPYRPQLQLTIPQRKLALNSFFISIFLCCPFLFWRALFSFFSTT